MSDSSTVQDAKQATSEVAEHASSKVGDVAASAKSEARSVAVDARDQAAGVLHNVRAEVRTQADDRARSFSGTLDDFGRQLVDMANGNNEADSQVSQLVRSAGDTVAERARRLDEDGIDGLIDDAKRLARNRPVMFLAGAVAIGFGIGRLAKHADLHQVAEKAKAEIDTDGSKDTAGSQNSSAPEHSSPVTGKLPTPEPTDLTIPAGGATRSTTLGEVTRP